MASNIDSFLNLDYFSSITSTSTRISRSKASPIYEYTRPPRNDKSKKDLSNGRKFFYYNYCSYGNAIIINFRQHLLN
jgi:hypothetical protein